MCGNHHHPSIYIYISIYIIIYIYVSHPGTPICFSGDCYTQTWFHHMKPQYITVMSKKNVELWPGAVSIATLDQQQPQRTLFLSRRIHDTVVDPIIKQKFEGCIHLVEGFKHLVEVFIIDPFYTPQFHQKGAGFNHEPWRLLTLGKHDILTDSSILGDTVLTYNII